MIVKNLIAEALQRAKDHRIANLTIGLGYVAVTLDDNRTGLAYVFRNQLGPSCGVLNQAGALEEVPLTEMIQWAGDADLLKSSLGIAAINALTDSHEVRGVSKLSDAEVYSFSAEDVVGMIGYFTPFANKVKAAGAKLYAFDSQRQELPDVHPDEDQERYIPECTKLIVTGTVVINGTLDRILDLGKNAESFVLLGFSTPLYPQVFAETPVSVLAGSVVPVEAVASVHRIVSQGGGGRLLGKVVDKVNLKVGRR
ncbi:MAG: DUF364 domain-containing protein [Firmicutes bacterium]|nr:DUF364 domain-containing protein [Bacillota bacterium]